MSVLIVGAGPVGLFLACNLQKKGISCRLIDQGEPQPEQYSRAFGIHARSCELLEELGVIEPFLQRSLKVQGLKIFNEEKRLADVLFSEIAEETKYPHILSLPQGVTEKILTDYFEKLGGIVERNRKLVAFRQDSDGVDVLIKNMERDEKELISCTFLVGCDGAHSSVRKLLPVTFEGAPYLEKFSLLDAEIEWNLEHHMGCAFFHPNNSMFVIPLPKENYYRIIIDEFYLPTEAGNPIEPTQHGFTDEPVAMQSFQKILAQSCPNAVIKNPVWMNRFNISHRLVNNYSHGRVFLAGDAAHIHSPAGGQGMNMGFSDAYNLAWKLSFVLKYESPLSLLDTYSIERRTVAQGVITASDRMTQLFILKNSFAQGIRNWVLKFVLGFEFVQHSVVQNLSQLGFTYQNSSSPIVKNETSSFFGGLPKVAAGSRFPDAIFSDGSTLFSKIWHPHSDKLNIILVHTVSEIVDGSYLELQEIESTLKEEFADALQTHFLFHPAASSSSSVKSDESNIIFDSEGTRSFRHVYGLDEIESAIYILRPDGHVGYFSTPTKLQKVREFLHLIL